MNKLAIFASGRGSNACAVMDYFESNPLEGCVGLVVSNREDAKVLERARERGVEALYVPDGVFSEGSEQILSVLAQREINFIALAGFLKLVPSPIIEAYPAAIVNIHPSLLPKFGGRGMYGLRVHQAVIDAGETQTGITIHMVDTQYDKGGVIFQTSLEVSPSDDAQSLGARVLELEHYHYPRVIAKLMNEKNNRNN